MFFKEQNLWSGLVTKNLVYFNSSVWNVFSVLFYLIYWVQWLGSASPLFSSLHLKLAAARTKCLKHREIKYFRHIPHSNQHSIFYLSLFFFFICVQSALKISFAFNSFTFDNIQFAGSALAPHTTQSSIYIIKMQHLLFHFTLFTGYCFYWLMSQTQVKC